MIKLFQRDMGIQAVLIVTALLLLWGRALLTPEPMAPGEHPAAIYGVVCGWLAAAPRLAVVIAMLLVLIEGIALNLMLSNVNLVSQNSLLPTLLYIIAMSAGATTLTPAILASAVAIACLNHLTLRGSLLTIPSEKICGATLLIGFASMFYQPAVFLMLSYLLIASSYRLYNWKDWILMLLGFAAPYVLLVLVLYLTDSLATWWSDTQASLTCLDLQIGNAGTPATIASILLTAVILWSLTSVIGHISERPVLWQKNATTVMLFFVGGLGMMLYSPLLPLQTSLLAIPFAFVTYRLFIAATERHTGFGRRHKQRLWIYDLLLIAIIIAAFLC